jgi:acetyl esterase
MLEPTFRDISYGFHDRHLLDLYLVPSSVPVPLYVYIHGGGFMHNPWHNKNDIPETLLQGCVETGISVAAISYRLSETDPYPAAMEDGVRAVQFLRYKAAEFNLNAMRIAAGGASAGAGIAFWIGLRPDAADPDSSDPVERQTTRLTCIASWQAQTSYDPNFIGKVIAGPAHTHPALQQFFRVTAEDYHTPEVRRMFEEASALSYVSEQMPPVFLWYETPDQPMTANLNANDGIHHPIFGRLLKEKMDALGVECVVRYREDLPGLPQDQVSRRFLCEQVGFLKRHLSA